MSVDFKKGFIQEIVIATLGTDTEFTLSEMHTLTTE